MEKSDEAEEEDDLEENERDEYRDCGKVGDGMGMGNLSRDTTIVQGGRRHLTVA